MRVQCSFYLASFRTEARMSKASRDVYMVKFVEHDGHKSELGLRAYEVRYIFILLMNMH